MRVKKKKTSIEDLFGQKVERTGEPEWATPEEIKSIQFQSVL